ncbi:unnamed protein product [Brassica oleracea]
MYKLCGEEACYESFLILAKLIGSPIKSFLTFNDQNVQINSLAYILLDV